MFSVRCEWLLFAVVLSCCVALSACGASSGERCMEQDDCASDLMCCKSAPGLATPGMCMAVCEDRRPEPEPEPEPETDSGTPDGSGSADAAPDAAEDAAEEDAASDADVQADATLDGGDDAGDTDAGG
jgi:hypothetical protein